MSRSLPLAIALVLALGAPLAHAQDGAPQVLGAMTTPEVQVPTADPAEEEEEEYVEDEDEVLQDEDIEFCGGGDMSPVDLAFDEAEYGDPEVAHHDLVAALRSGQVDAWERPRAIAFLAELQLRRGEPGRAIVNFLRAERMEPSSIDESRVAYATALLMRGRTAEARAEAQRAHDELCTDYGQVACYGANLILARTAPDTDSRQAATDAARTLRQDSPDLEERFAQVHHRVAGS